MIAVLLYLADGGWIGFGIVTGTSDKSSELGGFDPVFDVIFVVLYVAGAVLLSRRMRAHRTWGSLLVSLAFVPVLLLVTFVFLMSLNVLY